MKRLILTIAVLCLAMPTAALATGEGWHDDFDAAQKVAKEEGKDLLVDFSGSDWCGWCIKLDKEVFQHAPFLDAAKKQYVLVVLDYPRYEEAKAKVPNPARNKELQAKFAIRGFPTVLLMDADGNVYAKTGYQRGGPEAYVKHIAEIREKFRPGLAQALDASKAVAEAEGDSRAAAIETALTLLEGLEGAPYAAFLLPAAKAAIASDADNAKGLKLRTIKILVSKGLADDETVAAAGRLDPKNELGLLELLLSKGLANDEIRIAVSKVDPKNEMGLLGLLLTKGLANDEIMTTVSEMDPKNEMGLLEKVMVAKMGKVRSKEAALAMLPTVEDFLVNNVIKDKDAAISMRANAAFWNWRLKKDNEKAKAHAVELKKLNPEKPNILGLIKQILGE
jgi:thioredoxin-related protein